MNERMTTPGERLPYEIAVVGAGYVGLTTAAVLSAWGHRVLCFDKNEARVRALQAGHCPIAEPRLPELLRAQVDARRLRFDTRADLSRAEIVFICVGTPPAPDGSAQLDDLLGVARQIGSTARHGAIVVIKSTVPVGTAERVRAVLEDTRPDGGFRVVSNPEFLRQGSAVADTEHPDRIVIGAKDREAAEALAALYEPTGSRVLFSDHQTAELTKYAANTFLATRLSFINELAGIADHVGADIRHVAEAIGLDKRIGPYFLSAGIGFGGSCLPKDLSALRHFAATAGCATPLLDAVGEVNYQQPRRLMAEMAAALDGLNGRTIALLGLAFKPGTGDLRDSRALELLNLLEMEGAHVRTYDPVALDEATTHFINGTVPAADAYDACRDADALIIATDWPEFAELDWSLVRQLLRRPYIFDGRNLLDGPAMASKGFIYQGVGQGQTGAKAEEPTESPISTENPIRLMPPGRQAPRFLLYSHDAMGLGHTRRNIALAAALQHEDPSANVIIASGTDDIRLLGVPAGIEVLKLPSLRKIANGHYTGRHLELMPHEVLNLRSELLAATVKSFRPHVMIVDQHPLGAGDELAAALGALRVQGGHAVLGLRDILDTPESVRADWQARGLETQILAHYRRVLLYGSRHIFDPVRQYGLGDTLAEQIRFCGYVANEVGEGHAPFERRDERPVVLAVAGGGEDGRAVLETFIKAAAGAPWRAIAVAGPYAPEASLQSLRRMAEEAGVELHGTVEQIATWLDQVDVLVCMGGYNTLVEALAGATPTVCLPRSDPRQEQLIRARAFAERGLLHYLAPEELSPERLRGAVTRSLAIPRAELRRRVTQTLDLNGARNASRHIYALVSESKSISRHLEVEYAAG